MLLNRKCHKCIHFRKYLLYKTYLGLCVFQSVGHVRPINGLFFSKQNHFDIEGLLDIFHCSKTYIKKSLLLFQCICLSQKISTLRYLINEDPRLPFFQIFSTLHAHFPPCSFVKTPTSFFPPRLLCAFFVLLIYGIWFFKICT